MPGDQAVGRGPLEQLLLLTPGPLRRDREPAVLDEAALVDQVGEVLARRPQAVPVPLGDRLRARLVGQEPLAGAKLGELRALALVAGLGQFAAHQAAILFRPGVNGADQRLGKSTAASDVRVAGMKSRLAKVLVLSTAIAAIGAAVALAGGIRNSGFEDGLNGWDTSDRGAGQWASLDATEVDAIDPKLQGPKAGERQALVTQDGPGSRLLLQDLELKPNRTQRLSLWIQYRNGGDKFASPNTFDTGGLMPLSARGGASIRDNQQLRVEVIKSSAPIRTVKRKQILATVLRTMPGDRLNSKWHRYGVNLSKYAGKKVTLRIAELDNLGLFRVGVDAVKLKSK